MKIDRGREKLKLIEKLKELNNQFKQVFAETGDTDLGSLSAGIHILLGAYHSRSFDELNKVLEEFGELQLRKLRSERDN